MLRALVVMAVLVGFASVAMAETASLEEHRRWRTEHGPIHTWKPAGYDAATAATIVYLHGYFADVDQAWKRYRLADQFRESGINALFIACEAPTSERDDIAWSSLGALLEVVNDEVALPAGRLIAFGHSGAHRTLVRWLDERRLDTMVLLDVAYRDLGVFAEWLELRDDRRLIDVGDFTRHVTDQFHDGLAGTVTIERFPHPAHGTLPARARKARIVYVRSHMGHMDLVTRGIAIPMLLRALSVPVVTGAERSAPLEPI